MVARLFPVNTGKALGLLGIGASVGFFMGRSIAVGGERWRDIDRL